MGKICTFVEYIESENMEFRTTITHPANSGYLDHRQHLLMLGSCFTENMGEWLNQRKFNVDINPMGTLYNPVSIAEAWERIVEGRPFTANELFHDHDLWHSYAHHSRFSKTDSAEALTEMNRRLSVAHDQLPHTQRLIVTWGTAYAFRLKSTGKIVANCHKQPASLFERVLLSVDEIVALWRGIAQRLQANNPSCRILFTVSPIRHLSDGAHGNQVSKATLLLAIDRLQQELDNCDYFPSYEIMMDDLRDYRFYNADMTHPSPTAVAYISEVLSNTYLTDESREIARSWHKLHLAMEHRPLTEDKSRYHAFLQSTLEKVEQFHHSYPYIDVTPEIEELKTRITSI